jgi:hypothetical protein
MNYFAVCGYNLIIVAGTAYLCAVHDWSLWCFLITACFMLNLKEKE